MRVDFIGILAGTRQCVLATLFVLLAAMAASAQRSPPPRSQVTDFFSSNRFTFWNGCSHVDGFADFPVAGRVKVADLNTPIPTDRVYFQFSQYHNALQSATIDINSNPILSRQNSLNEYMFGFEKIVFNDWWSVEMRMPVFGRVNSDFQDGAFVSTSDQIGNLSLILKRMLFRSDSHVMAVGCGISTPTGGDSTFTAGNQLFTVKNESAHLLPYMMFAWMPTQRFFAEFTLQTDIPMSGNRVMVQDMAYGAATSTVGRLDNQSLLYATGTAGYWVYQNPNRVFFTGVAALVAANYSTTLQELDVLSGHTACTKFNFDNGRSHFDIVNLSVALDVELASNSFLRIAGVLPLNSADQRFMDSEIKASVMQTW